MVSTTKLRLVLLPLYIISAIILVLSLATCPSSKSLFLAKSDKYKYGMFGYCEGDTCKRVGSGQWRISKMDGDTNWTVNDETRDSFTSVFRLSPVPLTFTIVSLIMVLAGFRVEKKFYHVLVSIATLIASTASIVLGVFVILVFNPKTSGVSYAIIVAGVLLFAGFVLSIVVAHSVEKQPQPQPQQQNYRYEKQTQHTDTVNVKPVSFENTFATTDYKSVNGSRDVL